MFGELYFLLEYRDEAISLQYSPKEEFTLPENLFVIGTMNTADRSIARIDAAMRRRLRASSSPNAASPSKSRWPLTRGGCWPPPGWSRRCRRLTGPAGGLSGLRGRSAPPGSVT
ncbi:MAG: hypothetical protein ACRDOI_21790 [Trebonia sp.]